MARRKRYHDYIRNYNNMGYKRKVPVLLSAIEYMQQYNGRTVGECIVLALAPSYEEGMRVIDEKNEDDS